MIEESFFGGRAGAGGEDGRRLLERIRTKFGIYFAVIMHYTRKHILDYYVGEESD